MDFGGLSKTDICANSKMSEIQYRQLYTIIMLMCVMAKLPVAH